MKKIIVYFLALLILAGCTSSTPVSDGQPTNVSLEETSIPTINPTLTHVPFPTKTSTPTLSPELMTGTAVESTCADGSMWGFYPDQDVSPDKQWFAINCHGIPNTLKVARFDKKSIWSVPAQDVTIGENIYPTSFGIYRWSLDGVFLYFLPSYYRGDGGYFITEPGLLRLDLKSGEVKTILEPFGAFDYTLSPNDELLAYSIFKQTGRIYIRSMASDLITTVQLPQNFWNVGIFEWTLDSKSFVFAAGVKGWDESNFGLSLYLYDVQTHSLTLLIDSDKRSFLPSEDDYDPNYGPVGGRHWLDKDRLVLRSVVDNSQWEINIRNREIKEYNAPN
jgi:hypothetical protein